LSQYRKADEAFNNIVPVRNATAAAANAGGVYTPAQFGVALRSTDRSAGKGATARGARPGQELQKDAQALLPSKVPDSGTAGRLLVGGLPLLPAAGAGTGYIDPSTAAMLSAPALLYTKTGQKLVAKTLLGERPAAIQKLGKGLRKRKGMFGHALSAPLVAD
jgi:hypothetical protein